MLDSQQCEQAFPGLFEEVERPMNDRMNSHITLDEINAVPQRNGYVRAMIYDQQVCFLSPPDDKSSLEGIYLFIADR